jgi:hypothetical protein
VRDVAFLNQVPQPKTDAKALQRLKRVSIPALALGAGDAGTNASVLRTDAELLLALADYAGLAEVVPTQSCRVVI